MPERKFKHELNNKTKEENHEYSKTIRSQDAERSTLVLHSYASNFNQQLQGLCHQQNARLAYDAVAGPMTGRVLAALPHGGKVTVYGGLSFKAVQADPDQFNFENKSVDGIWLGPWITSKNLIQIKLL